MSTPDDPRLDIVMKLVTHLYLESYVFGFHIAQAGSRGGVAIYEARTGRRHPLVMPEDNSAIEESWAKFLEVDRDDAVKDVVRETARVVLAVIDGPSESVDELLASLEDSP